MADMVAPTIPLEIGGKTRGLKYDFNALALVEEKTGKSALSGDIFQNLRATDLRFFIWAGLVHEQPDLMVEEVGSWIHMGNLPKITECIAQAFSAAMPKKDDSGPLAVGTPASLTQ